MTHLIDTVGSKVPGMPGKKLLVADDSLTIQKVIRLALSNEGYEIQAISDGADAIQQIATFRPDCVLVDVSLPTRTAFEIKREVNGMEDHRDVRFILMSSAFEKIDEAQADEVVFDGRLTKPFDPAHLRQILTEVLNAPRAPKSLPQDMPLDIEAPQQTSIGISLEPPSGFPPSSFDLPITPPGVMPPGESEDELWGKHEEAPGHTSERDEIKHLTESTIRMSGLADIPIKDDEEFDWKVNEQSIKPPSSMSDIGGSTFHPGAAQTKTPTQPSAQSHAPSPSTRPSHDDLPPPLPPISMQHEPPQAFASFSDPKMEEMIRRQVQETLEKMAQQILPEVAERVIKAEINKLLNEKF